MFSKVQVVTVAGTGPGDTVVVIGTPGGVGSVAVQVAGARVIGVGRSRQDVIAVRGLGANQVIDARAEDAVWLVRELTAGRGAQVVVDTGGMTFAGAVEMAARDARVPVISAPRDGTGHVRFARPVPEDPAHRGRRYAQAERHRLRALLGRMAPHFQSGRFVVPPIGSRPLDDAADRYADASRGGWRIVLRPGP
jgi:NADPH:quinone reductase-like Zn-dependent oxidoreductase